MAGQGRPKYILGERIAQGGMAEIYLGKIVGAEGFTRICAFKKILSHYANDTEFVSMFRNEAMLAKQLQNKNIVQVFDFDSDGGEGPMLVMEYVDGQDLRSILREAEIAKTRIPVELACHICAESLSGLAYAHSAIGLNGESLGIIHRDVSPQNILISFDGDIKITDFGIAKVQSAANVTRAGVLKGKFRYMSPEQASGQQIDLRSDVFAVGIILFEMLTMTRLFKGDNEIQILQAVRDCRIKSPNEIKGTNIPPELEAIVLKLLQKDPRARYQTARDAQRDLSRFIYSMRPDFFPGELADFMQKLFGSRISMGRERMRSTLALPVESVRQTSAPVLGQGTAGEGGGGDKAWQGSYAQKSYQDASNSGGPAPSGIALANPPPASNRESTRVELVGSGAKPTNHGRPTENSRVVNRVPQARGPSSYTRVRQAPSYAKGHSSRSMESVFIVLIVAVAVMALAFVYALKQRLISFESELELLPAFASQSRVQVEVDGNKVGNGAYQDLPIKLRVEAGQHTITVQRPGFRAAKIVFNAGLFGTRARETVVLGKDAPLCVVQILTIPDGAKINIDDGVFVGNSGDRISFVPVGRNYRVRVEHPRCSTLMEEIYIPPAAESGVFVKNFTLKNCRS